MAASVGQAATRTEDKKHPAAALLGCREAPHGLKLSLTALRNSQGCN